MSTLLVIEERRAQGGPRPRPDRLERWGHAGLILLPLATVFPLLAALDTAIGPSPWSGWWTTWRATQDDQTLPLAQVAFLLALAAVSLLGQWMLLVLPYLPRGGRLLFTQRGAAGHPEADEEAYLRWRGDRTRAMAACWALALLPPLALLSWWWGVSFVLHNGVMLASLLARATPGKGPLPFLWDRIAPPYDAAQAAQAWHDAGWTLLETYPEAVGTRVHLLRLGHGAGTRAAWLQRLRNTPGVRALWRVFEQDTAHNVHPMVAQDSRWGTPPAWLVAAAAAHTPHPSIPPSSAPPLPAPGLAAHTPSSPQAAGTPPATGPQAGHAPGWSTPQALSAVQAAVEREKPMRDAVLAAWVATHRAWDIPVARAENASRIFQRTTDQGWTIPIPDSRHAWLAFQARKRQGAA